ncbi:hypothetical protein [Psychromonas antarctica]|jgi:hypothetical protein|uniref:hypothetical protein n=1 Tax=Psychromonas antarctica TaxID=67573 RepID=UPI001EE79554|nr:hypothetical protein [Psychromonas antarctica]MCG6201472.1 hypothetical protein [Psychromonas antarctica]
MLRLPTWSIVMIGLLLNISAALVTHFIIDGKNSQLNRLSMQMSNNKKGMDLLWLQIEGVERKREILYLLLNQGELNESIAKSFRRLLESHLHEPIPVSVLLSITAIDIKINDYQDNIREEIDNKFFLNLELTERQMLLNKEISTLRNWSIFLQMIGLSLILARDLSRKR